MTPTLVCPHCGTRNPPGSNFCNRCGAALAGDLESTPGDPAAPLESESPSSGYDEAIDATPEPRPVEALDEAALGGMFNAETETHAAWPGGAVPGQETILFPDEQLLGGGQGYLESVAIAGEAAAADALPSAIAGPYAPSDNEHWRTLRTLIREEPLLAAAPTSPHSSVRSYGPLWIVLLILLAAILPFTGDPFGDAPASSAPVSGSPVAGAAQPSASVRAAYDAIRALDVDDHVLVFWQYDPATAGELDLAALPVVSNLLEREIRSQVITLLPAGLASARRLYAAAVAGLDESAMKTVIPGWIGGGLFLTGGTAALPLIAQRGGQVITNAPAPPPAPRLVLVFAAQTDDVRHWLEIVQPVNWLPVVAVTSAAADPTLLPYLQSGQLVGLVSGFDGAAAYQALRAQPLPAAAQRRQNLVTQAQNWGALALVLILLAGNLMRLFWRQRHG